MDDGCLCDKVTLCASLIYDSLVRYGLNRYKVINRLSATDDQVAIVSRIFTQLNPLIIDNLLIGE